MAKVNPQIILEIEKLSKKELEKLVLKAASKDKSFHDFLLINYADKDFGEKDLFEKAKADLEMLFRKNYKGFSEELKLANMLAACHKRIDEFGKVCKEKKLELDLVLRVLEIPFSLPEKMLETCFTKYNFRVVLLVKKAIGLYYKLHEDYKIEYAGTLSRYLEVLHRSSNHLDYVYNMQKTL